MVGVAPWLMRGTLVWEMVLYGVGVLVVSGLVPRLGQWYAKSDHLRVQVKALLQGSLSLSDDPSRLTHDLLWAEGGVQQVWGLGVPLWRLPFEIGAILLGQPDCPDRLALSAALCTSGFLVLRTWLPPLLRSVTLKRGCSGVKWNVTTECSLACALGTVGCLLLFPPFLSLLSCRGDVYEEVVAYEYLYALILAAGVVTFSKRLEWRRLVVLNILAGSGGMVRPTLVFYGAATLIVTLGLVTWSTLDCRKSDQGGQSAKERLLDVLRDWRNWAAMGAFGLGAAGLFVTNVLRFGDGFEFGHKLNVQGNSLLGSVYATRFDYLFKEEPLWRTGRELFGALFLVDQFNKSEWYAKDIFPGQSPTDRWREFYFTTYDVSYAVLVGVGWGVGLWQGQRWLRGRTTVAARAETDAQSRPPPLPAILAIWSLLATAPLAAFYLRTPVISSRYMMDFAPAFAVAIVGAWLGMMGFLIRWKPHARWPRVLGFCVLCAWLGKKIDGADNAYGPPVSMTWTEVKARRKQLESRPLACSLPAYYRLGDDLSSFNIPYNGEGWVTEDGTLAQCVILFVDSPQFLELEVVAAPNRQVGEADVKQFRAKVGLEFLQRESIGRTPEGWRLRFSGPQCKRYQHGVQPVFIATVPKEELANSQTPWRLLEVCWRGANKDK